MNLTIIQLGILNLNSCIELDQKALKGLWTKSQWEKELSDPLRICLGAVELDTKNLIGVCSGWLIFEEIHVTSFAVHPLYQRKGIGRLILKDLINRSDNLGTNQILLEVKNLNEPAKALYESMGFKIKGHRSKFYKDGSDALVYIKDLTKK